MFVILLSSLTSAFSAKWKRMEANTYAVLATSRLQVNASICIKLSLQFLFGCVCKASLGAGGASAMAMQPRNECSQVQECLFGSLFQCFSLWAALLRLKRTKQYRSSTLRIFFFLLSCHPKGIKTQCFQFPFNTYFLL